MGGDIKEQIAGSMRYSLKRRAVYAAVDPVVIATSNFFVQECLKPPLPKPLADEFASNGWKRVDDKKALDALEIVRYHEKDMLYRHSAGAVLPCLRDVAASYDAQDSEGKRFFLNLDQTLSDPTPGNINLLKRAAQPLIGDAVERLSSDLEQRPFKRIGGGFAVVIGLGSVLVANVYEGMLFAGIGAYFLLRGPTDRRLRQWQGYQQLLDSPASVWQAGIRIGKEPLESVVARYNDRPKV